MVPILADESCFPPCEPHTSCMIMTVVSRLQLRATSPPACGHACSASVVPPSSLSVHVTSRAIWKEIGNYSSASSWLKAQYISTSRFYLFPIPLTFSRWAMGYCNQLLSRCACPLACHLATVRTGNLVATQLAELYGHVAASRGETAHRRILPIIAMWANIIIL